MLDSMYMMDKNNNDFLMSLGIVNHTDCKLPRNNYILGTITLKDNASVNIWVCAMPAKFWTFEITTKEDNLIKLQTGSGNIQDFWPTVLLFAEGMIGIS